MNTIELFKSDLWNGIWLNTKKMFRPMTIISIVSFALSMLLVFTIFVKIFGPTITESVTNPGSMFDLESMEERSQAMEDFMMSNGPSNIFAIVGLFYVVMLVVASWVINFLLLISESVVNTGSGDVLGAFKSSFNKNVVRILVYILLTLVIYMGLGFVSALLAGINPFIMILALLVVVVFLLRLSAGYGAIVHGGMGVSDAFSFSLKHITWVRAIKIILVAFVIGLIYTLVLLAVGGVADLIGSAGIAILFIGQIAMGILMYSLMTTAYSAMYYRYAELDLATDEEVHIIDTEE